MVVDLHTAHKNGLTSSFIKVDAEGREDTFEDTFEDTVVVEIVEVVGAVVVVIVVAVTVAAVLAVEVAVVEVMASTLGLSMTSINIDLTSLFSTSSTTTTPANEGWQ